MNEPGRLWIRVIKARYGEFVTKRERGRPKTVAGGLWDVDGEWWRDISSLYVGKDGKGMARELVRIFGERREVSFWADPWCEGGILRSSFLGCIGLVATRRVL